MTNIIFSISSAPVIRNEKYVEGHILKVQKINLISMILGIFPENISTYGSEIDSLFWLIVGITFFAFFVSLYVLLKPLFTNNHKKVPRASYITGHEKKYMRWVVYALIGLTLSDFVILGVEHSTWVKLEQEIPDPDFEVGIIGRQWNWIFVYPGPDGKLFTQDDVRIDEMNSELHLPTNKNIVVHLMAKDVLHSFWVSNIRLKQDCIPGRTNKRWFNLTREGKYDLACAEICGVLHSKMRNFIVAEPEEKFRQFITTLYAPKTEEGGATGSTESAAENAASTASK
jgi:cytochrome c oxidase subunit 2